MFCQSEDTDTMRLFFRKLRLSLDNKPIKPDVFVSDMALCFYNAWCKEMAKPEHYLYCMWHVLNAWTKQIPHKVKELKRHKTDKEAFVRHEIIDLLDDDELNPDSMVASPVDDCAIPGEDKLRRKDLIRIIKYRMYKMIREPSEATFKSQLADLRKFLIENKQFQMLAYFTAHYGGKSAIEEENVELRKSWAGCYRKNIGINANSVCESFHRQV